MVGNLIIREQNDTGRLEKNVQKTDDRTKKFCLVKRVGKDILYQKILSQYRLITRERCYYNSH